jgi:hypothetical protein
MKRRAIRLGILCVLVMALSACGGMSSTPIGKIVDNPREYAGKIVTISGEVGDTFSLVVVKYFTVKDATGELPVVTRRPLPKKGTRIEVRGKVEEAFSIGDRQLLVLVETEPER